MILTLKSNCVNQAANIHFSEPSQELNGYLQIKQKNDTNLFLKKTTTGSRVKKEYDTQAAYGPPTLDNHYIDE